LRMTRLSYLALICLLPAAALGAVAQSASPSFTLKLSTDKVEFHVGDAVWIHVVQTNVSDHSVSCDYAGGNTVNLIYDYQVTTEDGSPATRVEWSKPVPPPYSYRECAINPGESSRNTTHLNNLYKLDKPGQYAIQISRLDPDTKDESGKPLVVSSNTITITITAAP